MGRDREEDWVGDKKTHVFIVGSKGIPAQYGGFETFVENLTAGKIATNIQYHVSCMNNHEKHFKYNNADCFNVKLPIKGAPGRILHVARALSKAEKWKKKNIHEKTIVYILGCRIGPLLIPHAKRMKRLGIKICVNPDGLEWKRDKWNRVEKKFLKYCESCLVRYSDLVICDSLSIKKYVQKKYGNKIAETIYIPYGASIEETYEMEELNIWYKINELTNKSYYLVVGRFVPENNLELIINEFMKSKTKKDLVIISNFEHNKFYKELAEKTNFQSDVRIKMVGTVYNQDLLRMIRNGAYGYIHGHEVGGTNPSLLESLACTDLNLLLDVAFNKEVALDSALYWKKENGNLEKLLEQVDKMSEEEISRRGDLARRRIKKVYNWEKIIGEYENLWLTN